MTRLEQRYALMVLYYANDGEAWSSTFVQGWAESGVHECSWSYVACDSNSNSNNITELVTGKGMKLVGSLPAEIALLSSLEHLNLFNNRLEGNLPATLFSLSNLGKFQRDE
jgi:hypothetical protein